MLYLKFYALDVNWIRQTKIHITLFIINITLNERDWVYSIIYIKFVTSAIAKFGKINSDLYIDNTIIWNIGCIEDISHNHKIKSKGILKLSIINSKDTLLSIHTVNSNYYNVSLVFAKHS